MDITQMKVGNSLENPFSKCITQEQIQDFADATGDHQWIHLDEEKCIKLSPYKTTVAHGLLTLSLMPKLFAQCVEIDPTKITLINYGIDNLRFIEAVRVNDNIKYKFTLIDIEEKEVGSLYKFEGKALIEGREKPALIGTFLTLIIPVKK